MTQDQALKVLKTGASVFLTGEPGSGKTHTINLYVSLLRACGIEPAITASTGIAATHIGGFTIHSWSGIGIRDKLSPYDLDRLAQNERLVKRLERTKVLIIDEVSMLSAATMSLVDQTLRALRRSDVPFGGLQTILVGDFFQLPPVVRRTADYSDEQYSAEKAFAYHAPAWTALNPIVCYLSEQHRQADENFLDLLSAMRGGLLKAHHLALLKDRHTSVGAEQYAKKATKLFSHNVDVDRVNDAQLERLPGEPKIFKMSSRGASAVVEQLRRSCLSPDRLILKVGAKVMFTKNSLDQSYANGTVGEVVNFRREDGLPVVKTIGGKIIVAELAEWSVEADGREIAAISQIPLRLAWAITVHKSQGMSLDEAVVDLSQAFEYGQGYVALSRVRSLAGLYLLGFNRRALEVHPHVRERDVEFRERSQEAVKAFSSMSAQELDQMHQSFIKACGGYPIKRGSKVPTWVSAKRQAKISTFEQTRQMIADGQSIEAVARERGLTIGTIVSHIERLVNEKKLNAQTDLAHIAEGWDEHMSEIHTAFDKLGADALAPIFQHFSGKIPYETLRLARVFYSLAKK
jgi:hypothetical protein